jgi:hypothetical protein
LEEIDEQITQVGPDLDAELETVLQAASGA